MPEAARPYNHISATAQAAGRSWSGEAHGGVGVMHRAIEQRLLAESFAMAVVPLPTRPAERILALFSRVMGWAVLAGIAVGLITALTALIPLPN